MELSVRRLFFVGRRRALRVALADFSATPWRGLEKSERCPSLASLFPPQAAVGSAAVRIHPWICFEKFRTKEKLQHLHDAGVLGGRGWMSRAAHLKKPRRGFFALRTIRRALRVALAAFSAAPWQGFEKAERCPSLASLFPPRAAVGSAVVRIHP